MSLPRLKLRLTKGAETAVRRGHPWVFADRIKSQNRPGEVGEMAVVYDASDKFLAVGLYEPKSAIPFRALHIGAPVTIDDAWWEAHFASTLAPRLAAFGPETNGYRCINGESEGWPGLVVDRYGDHFVVKLYFAAWLPLLPRILSLIQSQVSAESVTLRLSRNIQEVARAKFQREEGPIFGEPPEPVIFSENGLRFEADVLKGQKTGFFLDQRENRQRVERLANGRDVLNVFSFTGGFSLYAARGGANRVVEVDISQHALDGAKRNFILNERHPQVARVRHESIQADAFEWLEHAPNRKFDLVITDPPSLAKRESERAVAAAAYQKLNTHAMARIKRGGVLVAASCSAHVSSDEFFTSVRRSAHADGRRWRELWMSGHPSDHPSAIPEARYLKCLALQSE